MLSNRWLKNYVRTAENCHILYAKFYVLFKNIQRKIATKFLSTLVLSLALENFICAKPIQKYFNMLQSCSIGCSLANSDTKDPTVMQIRLITKSALFVYLKILQLNHNLQNSVKTLMPIVLSLLQTREGNNHLKGNITRKKIPS